MTTKLINKLAIVVLIHVSAVMTAQEVVVDTLGGGKSVAVSPADLLKGEVSGVRVSAVDASRNGLQNVHVRGLNTLRGDSQPLWIVDGVVIGSAACDNLDAFYLSGGLTDNGDKLPDVVFIHGNADKGSIELFENSSQGISSNPKRAETNPVFVTSSGFSLSCFGGIS